MCELSEFGLKTIRVIWWFSISLNSLLSQLEITCPGPECLSHKTEKPKVETQHVPHQCFSTDPCEPVLSAFDRPEFLCAGVSVRDSSDPLTQGNY